MILKKILSGILCLALLPGLTGCWNRREPKTLAIIMSLIYDITEQGNYKVTVELMKPTSEGSGSGGGMQGSSTSPKSSSIIAVGEDNSMPGAVRKISLKIEKTPYSGQNHVRFFTEKFVRTGMVAALDYFSRDHLVDESPLMFVIKGEPQKLYSCSPKFSQSIGIYMDSLYKSQPKLISQSAFVTTLDFIKDFHQEGKEPVMGVVEIAEVNPEEAATTQTSGQEKEYELICRGLAAFKDGKLAGYMDAAETAAYNFVVNKVKSAYVTVPAGDGESILEVIKSKADIKTSLEDGKVKLDIKVKVLADMSEETGTIDISKIAPIKEVEQSFNGLLEENIAQAVKHAQTEFGSDIFGFGVYFHIQHPKQWKEIKSMWNQIFSRAEVNVTVTSSVTRTGEIKEPFQLED